MGETGGGRPQSDRDDTPIRWASVDWDAHHRQSYETTGNPVFVWEVIRQHLVSDRPLPAWARDYLLAVALNVSQLSRSRIPTKAAINRAVADALRLKGRGGFNPFRELSRPAHEISIAMAVYTHYSKQRAARRPDGTPDKWTAIFADVAQSHACELCTKRISAGTVRRYWYAHALTVIPRRLIERARSQKVDDILR